MNNNEQELHARVAGLESQVDQLESELSYINEMLIRCGFPTGIVSLKETMQEMIEEGLVPEHQKRAS